MKQVNDPPTLYCLHRDRPMCQQLASEVELQLLARCRSSHSVLDAPHFCRETELIWTVEDAHFGDKRLILYTYRHYRTKLAQRRSRKWSDGRPHAISRAARPHSRTRG